MRTLLNQQEALANVQQLLKTPDRFYAWLATAPDRLFRTNKKGGRNPLVRFLIESGVPGVYQSGDRLYVVLTPLELPEWAQNLNIPTNRDFLARYLLWRMEQKQQSQHAA